MTSLRMRNVRRDEFKVAQKKMKTKIKQTIYKLLDLSEEVIN